MGWDWTRLDHCPSGVQSSVNACPDYFLTRAANPERSEQIVVPAPSPSPGHTPISGLWTNQTANRQAVWRIGGAPEALGLTGDSQTYLQL